MKLSMKSQIAVKLTLALLLCPATSIFANTAHHPKDYKDYGNVGVSSVPAVIGFGGWLAGVGLGINTFTGNSSSVNTTLAVTSPLFSGPPGDSSSSTGHATIVKLGPMGNLFAGYGYLHDIYYAGVNLGVNIIGANTLQSSQTSNATNITTNSGASVSVVTASNSVQTQTKITRGWAQPFIDIKLGGLITPQTLAYGIIGTSYNSLTIKSSSTYVANGNVSTFFGAPPATPTASATSVSGQSTTKYFFGLRLGAGMEVLLSQHVGVAADYVYSFYPTYKTSISSTGSAVACDAVSGCVPVSATVTNNTKTVLNDQQVMAKFIYHIG